MRYDLVIFDLDGTVLNTLDDLTDAVNYAMDKHGFPVHTTEDVRRFIGNGVARAIRLALPEGVSDETHAAALADFKVWYSAHVNDRTRPYPGIPELLQALRDAGVKTAVNSNKMDTATQALCAAHFPGLLDCVLGEKADIPKKPAPDGALMLIQKLGARPERTLYVGDGDTDVLTAQNAGIDGAWVSWGFRKEEELAGLAIPRRFDSVEALRCFILEG